MATREAAGTLLWSAETGPRRTRRLVAGWIAGVGDLATLELRALGLRS